MGSASNLTYLLQHLSAVISRQSDQLLHKQVGVGLSQFRILMALEWNPRVQQKSIADSLGQTEASISRQIGILKDKKLLSTRQDPQNRRRHITIPTTQGMQVTEMATNILRHNFNSEINNLDEDQLLQLTTGLQELHKIVCQPGKLGACDHALGL